MLSFEVHHHHPHPHRDTTQAYRAHFSKAHAIALPHGRDTTRTTHAYRAHFFTPTPHTTRAKRLPSSHFSTSCRGGMCKNMLTELITRPHTLTIPHTPTNTTPHTHQPKCTHTRTLHVKTSLWGAPLNTALPPIPLTYHFRGFARQEAGKEDAQTPHLPLYLPRNDGR